MAVTGTPISISGSPVTVGEAKTHLRIADNNSDDDDYIQSLLLAATAWAEEFQGRTYISRSRTHYLHKFHDKLVLPYPPLSSVTSITYIDSDGAEQTLDASYYQVDTDAEPGVIVEAYGMSWPATRDQRNAVTITYVAGYGDADSVPDEVKHAIKLAIGHWYEHRESVSETKLFDVPEAASSLLWLDRVLLWKQEG